MSQITGTNKKAPPPTRNTARKETQSLQDLRATTDSERHLGCKVPASPTGNSASQLTRGTSHRLWNRLMYALHGNSTLHLNGHQMLEESPGSSEQHEQVTRTGDSQGRRCTSSCPDPVTKTFKRCLCMTAFEDFYPVHSRRPAPGTARKCVGCNLWDAQRMYLRPPSLPGLGHVGAWCFCHDWPIRGHG